MGQVLEQNLPHELHLIVPVDGEHAGGQVPLQRAEDHGGEVQLEILVAVGLVILVRVQPQPLLARQYGRRSLRRLALLPAGDHAVTASRSGRAVAGAGVE